MSDRFNLNVSVLAKMGKKNKRKQSSSDVQEENVMNGSSTIDEPATKRRKEMSAQGWYPGRFVLLKQPAEKFDDTTNGNDNTPKQSKLKKKEKQLNGKTKKVEEHSQFEPANGKEISLKCLEKDDLSSSDNDEWMDQEEESLGDSDSMSDEEVSEEWSTDTDYSEGDSMDEEEYSYNESDCESVNDDDYKDQFWNDEGSEDSDYIPDIEDKYIKRGEAIFHEAKGLNLAFGNSEESQIIEINNISPAIMPQNDEEVPQLVPPDGEEIDEEENEDADEDPTEKIQNLSDDDGLRSTLLETSAVFFDCIKDQGVVLKLSNTIHFHGVLIIRAIANSVEINGYKLQSSDVITAPSIARADYFLNLTPVFIEKPAEDKLSDELNKLLKAEDAARLVASFDYSKEVLVHLQHGPSDSKIEMLKNYSPNPLLPNKKMLMNNSSELILSAKFFKSSENLKVSTFQQNKQWQNIQLQSSSRLIVAGGKNVGKSGLCQFLINESISSFKKILLIDLDIGQPICCPAQTVSATLLTNPIIGPGYLSKNHPDKCLFYGDKSVMISPFKYVRCIKQLVKFCNENKDYLNIPWIVNTMGYQKGFGLQLICILVKILQPTEVIQIQHGINSYNFSKIITEELVNKFEFNFFDAEDIAGIPTETFFTTHVLDSIVNNHEVDLASKWISNAMEKRKLAILAQLSRLLKGNQSCLNDVTPFVAPINRIQMVVMDEEYSQHEQGFNLDLLNGNMVYLCHANVGEKLNSTSILNCHGLGIVRGIDKINEKVYILLPQTDSSEKLQAKVDVLAIGNIPLPAEILLKQSFNIAGNIPHVTFFKERNASSKKYVNKRNIKDCY